MLVYVFSNDWCRYGEGDTELRVFANLDKAMEVFNYERKEALKDFDGEDFEADEYVDGDMNWSIWEAGAYTYNHISLSVHQMEVE